MIGIDLGTTNSVAAIMDGPQPRVLENREARTQTRSVVGLKKRKGKGGESLTEVLVGDAAVDNWPLAPKDTVFSVKRLMGRGAADAEVQRVRSWALYDVVEPSEGTRDSVRVVMGGRQYSPVEISSLILKKVKDDAEFRLGEPVTHAVITVPAYFSQIQRDATRKAGVLAGLKVIKILDEPTAAAIAFGVQAPDDTPKTVLVYDLGGGTFDISVLMCAGNVFAPLNLEGDMWLGGDNFDQAVMDHVVEHVRRENGLDPRSNLRFMAELRRAAQALKERLSSAEAADLIVTGLLQDPEGNLVDVEMEFTRSELERLIAPLVVSHRRCGAGHPNLAGQAQCTVCGAGLERQPVLPGRALELTLKAIAHPSVGLPPEQVDVVLMAGNSTNVPLVQRSMEEVFGAQKVVRRLHPKHSVAMGAAIVAAWMGRQCVCQAPDPDDPSRECGHVNPDDVGRCARCGASMEAEAEPRAQGPGASPAAPALGNLGGIAPFSYGAQYAGDAFHVFVKKGDPFPTPSPQSQIFRTRLPRQRMVSIPIFGGDSLERASANEKQGEAFAVLPPDLPQGAVVRIKLWLDRDGVFELAAHLDDGTDLRPWVVKGEQDARAIEAIQEVDKALAAEGVQLQSMVVAKVEVARNRVFDRLRDHDFTGALEEARQARAQVEAAAAAPQETPEAAARSLLRWADFVLERYPWAFPATVIYRLQGLVSDLRGALGSGDPARTAAAYQALDSATAALPQVVDLLLRIRHTIANRVRPADPARAATLVRRVENLEEAFRAGASDAATQLDQLVSEVVAGAEGAAQAGGLRCSKGHSVPKGDRRCPQCGEDTWSLDAGSRGGGA
jgi:molecular chaperone DnaK (HSP70)